MIISPHLNGGGLITKGGFMKKILPILLCIILIFSTNITVNAQQNNNEFYETNVDNTLVFTSLDSNLPSTGNYYFGITSDGFVWYVPMNKAIPMIMNKVIGVTLKPEALVSFISDYLEFGLVNSPYKPVYNGATKIGIAFEDLTGKTLLGSNNTTDVPITIPSVESNNVYNYYNQWFIDEGYDDPDWISVETRNKDFFLNKLDAQNNRYQALTNFLNSSDYNVTVMQYKNTNMTYGLPSSDSWLCDVPTDKQIFVCQGDGFGQTFLNSYNLSTNKNTLNFTDMMLGGTGAVQMIYLKNTDNISALVVAKYPILNTDGTYRIDTNGYRYYIGSYMYLPCSDMPYITIFKNTTVLNQIVNQTYAPVTFNTQQYYDYSESNDNSVTSTSSEVNNSTTTNETIYNESAESFTEYYSENNYHIDNSVTISNTTEIVNNYYGDDSGGDDNGGGSGGGSDDSDGTLLDRLLNAIIDFFKNIGKIIGALLAGLFELLNSVLDAIANINNSFEGIKNFLSSIFSWFPSEIVTLMVLGLGLALLASFITWFKK